MELSTLLHFTNESLLRNVSLDIIDDSLLEVTIEDFIVTLSLVDPRDDEHILLMPESAIVAIMDDDSKIVLYYTHKSLY